MHEPGHPPVVLRDNGAIEAARSCEALRPDGAPVLEDLPIEVLVGVRTAVVPSPAFGVKSSDDIDVPFGRLAELHKPR